MNILSLVFFLALALSFGFSASLEKESTLFRIHKAFVAQQTLHHNLFIQFEKHAYRHIGQAKKKVKKKDLLAASHKRTETQKTPPLINPVCAKLNLWPLLQAETPKEHILSSHFLRLLSLYQDLFQEGQQEPFFLAWLKGAKALQQKNPKGPLLLEKVAFEEPEFRRVYYRMLKGKRGSLPPLLDLIKATESFKEKLCLKHASLPMLTLLFGKAASSIFEELHQDVLGLSEERMDTLCRESHELPPSKTTYELLNLSCLPHASPKEITLYEEDAKMGMSLRKKISKK